MSLDELLARLVNEGKLREHMPDINYLNNILESASKNFEAAGLLKEKIDEAAKKFWRKVRVYLKTRNPQLHLFEDF